MIQSKIKIFFFYFYFLGELYLFTSICYEYNLIKMKSNDYTQNDVSFNEKSPSINEEECNVNNNSLTSFLHR